MTTVCSGGASQQIPGTSDTVLLTSAVIASILGPVGLGWLEPFIGYLAGVITLNLPTFCATDPPADPGVSAADLLALATLGPGPLTADASDRVGQLIQRFAWYRFCQCSSIATPAPPSPPSEPAGSPVINPPGQVGPGTADPCASFLFAHTGSWGTTGQVFAMVPFSATSGNPATGRAIPAGATSVLLHYTVSSSGVAGAFAELDYNFYDSVSLTNSTGSGSTSALAGHVSSTTLIVPSGTAAMTVVGTTGSTSGAKPSLDVSGSADVYCGGLPGQTQSPCCPPDPIATAKLDNILSLLTLIQRQAAPFAYVTGAVHSGLSGDGSFSIGSILGVLLNVSVPARAGRDAGTPVTVFDCGWINFATLDGYTERFFVSSDSQVILPRLPGIYTNVGYSFATDVTVTVTEISREP